MKQTKIAFTLLIIVMVICGCASFPVFKTGMVSREYMTGLLPVSSDLVVFLNFRQMEEENLLTEAIMSGISKNADIGNFLKECKIDPAKDLYSVSFGFTSNKAAGKSEEIAMVINLKYDWEIMRQKLLKDGYREGEVDSYKLSLFSRTENDTRFTFLSENLILITSGTTVNEVLDQHNKRTGDKAWKSFINALKKNPLDAPFLLCMRSISKYVTADVAGNPFINLFINIDEISLSMDYTQIDIMGEVLLTIKDTSQRETLYSLLQLTIQAGDTIEDAATREILRHTSISKADAGIKLSMVIPILTILSLFSEYEGTSI